MGFRLRGAVVRSARRLCALVVVLTLAGAAVRTTAEADDARPDTDSLAGRLLVAAPEMPDPRFAETVIYMIEHDDSGAMGLVVNRPMGTLPLTDLLSELGLDGDDVTGEMRVHYGGPVERGQGFVLHSADYVGKDTRVVDKRFAVTARGDILRDIASGAGPRQALVVFGYAGWGAGQLEGEIARGGWITIPADEALVFGDDDDAKWRRASARQSIDL